METRPTFCQMCNAQCGVLAYVEDGRVVRVEGDPEDPGNRGELCIKGQHTPDILYAEDRLRYPLLRKNGGREGDWRRASWDDAIEFMGSRLEQVRQRFGPEALTFYMGSTNMALDTMMVRRLARVFGTSNFTRTWSVCVGPKVIGYEATFGAPRMPWCDLRHAKYILLWGTNPTVSHIHRYHAITSDILAAQKDGAKLAVVDPRRTELAERADTYLQIRPGADLALALSMIHTIIKLELYDREFVRRHAHGFDQLAEQVKPYTPAWAEGITDIPAVDIEALAKDFAATKPASLERREGVQHSTHGTQTLRAMAILLALTGNVDVPGGLHSTPLRPLRDLPLPDDLPKPKPAFWQEQFPLADDCSGGVPEAILGETSHPVRALIAIRGNPLSCFPNTEKTIRALNKLDLLVVHDLFMTETTEFADVVLPACTFFEKSEIAPKSLRADRRLRINARVVEPLYEALPEWKFLSLLAQRLGYAHLFSFHDEEEIIDGILKASGFSWDDLTTTPAPWTPGELLERGFSTPTKKIELHSTVLEKHGYDPLPRMPLADSSTSGDYPYFLITGVRHSAFSHSQHRNIPALLSLQPEPLAEVGRTVAKETGVRDGEWIEVRTTTGSAIFKVAVSDKLHPRTVSVPHGWRGKHNANWLTDDSTYDPIAGTPAYKDLRCRVSKRGRDL